MTTLTPEERAILTPLVERKVLADKRKEALSMRPYPHAASVDAVQAEMDWVDMKIELKTAYALLDAAIFSIVDKRKGNIE